MLRNDCVLQRNQFHHRYRHEFCDRQRTDFFGLSAAGATGARTVVRVMITLTATWAGLVPPPARALGSSMETYDTLTGVTHAFAAGTTPPLTGVVTGVLKGQVHDAITNK